MLNQIPSWFIPNQTHNVKGNTINMSTVTKPKTSSKPSISFQQATEFGGGKRWEGGIGTVTRSVYSPWHYPAPDIVKYQLFALVTFTDEAGDDHEVPYQAGFFGDDDILNNAYPSRDGVTPAGPEGMDLEVLLDKYAGLAAGTDSLTEEELPDYQGPYVVFPKDPENPDRPCPKLPKKDWAQFISAVEGLPEFQNEDGTSSFPKTTAADCVVGYKFDTAYFKQANKSKNAKGTYEVLVPVASFGLDEEFAAEQEEETPKSKTTSKGSTGTGKPGVKPATSKSRTAPVAEETEEEEIEETEEETEEGGEDEIFSLVEGAIFKVLKELGRPALKKDFYAKTMKLLPQKSQVDAVDVLNNTKWLTSGERLWTFKNGQFSVG